ncbi:MAG: hypothetical protein WCV79_02225 [Candidatus Paceibacterota bacterium]
MSFFGVLFNKQSWRQRQEDNQRITVKKEWVQAANSIAERTKHFHARQLCQFLNGSAAAAPHANGCRVLERKESTGVFIIPVMSDSDNRCSNWDRLISSDKSVAYYLEDLHSIVVREHAPCTPIWRGLILLHEASHAFQKMTQPSLMHDKAIEEQRVYAFENRLIEMLFGSKYSHILRNAVNTIDKNRFRSESKIVAEFGWLLPFIEDLDELYGPALSQAETRARHACFVTHVYFTLFEEIFGDQQAMLKRVFTQKVLVPS